MRVLRCLPAILLALMLSLAGASVLAVEPARAPFKPAVPPGPEGDTFTFVVMADPQPRDAEHPTATPREFFDTIREVNERAPAFSVICGDLIMGYVGDTGPIGQMWDNFLESLAKFDQPVFCVIGNHDVWQKPTEDYFLERFGDVRWYSFDYGPAHFIVLDSEVVGEMNRIGPKQLEWLKSDLEASRDTRFKFVFIHKPYPHLGAQWDDEIHPLLARYGTTAVFAGHWHSQRKDRMLDGVTYYVLSAAGGIGNNDELGGGFRSFMEVTVAKDKVSYALNRGGEILPDDYVTAAQVEAVDALRRGRPITRMEMPPVDLAAGMDGIVRVEVTNPTPYRIEYALSLELSDAAKIEAAGEPVGVLASEGTAVHEFRVTCPPSDETHTFPQAVVKGRYIVAFPHMTGRIESSTTRPVSFDLPDELPAESKVDRCVKLDGTTTAVQVGYFDQLNVDGPFTLEAWFNVDELGWRVGGMNHTEGSSYGLFLAEGGTAQARFLVCDAATGSYAEARAKDATPLGRWVHYACTSDGKKIALWLDGRKVAEADAPARIKPNELPMYIGADVEGNGAPSSFLRGCVDEFRFSTVCRYTEEFTPPKRFTPDKDTLILYHLDRVLVNRLIDASGNGHHGILVGNAELVER